ncbi:Y-family DNA polymerase [Pelagibacterium lacus]|uniref:DNA polymerase Y family protein n=1 Tax=Pelagibacterium lacus TaxID=2282655 RepID=A0A369W1E5_9HYPH|nr:DNA polymerase Y family protein [Pelagibacterium lacus]RDE08358.1 DNA polymerase Y family protein [Pelagibacterium lacus]
MTVAKRSNALRIAAADAAAQRLGLHPGLAFTDAKLRVAHIEVVEHDAAADLALLERIADWGDRYSPIIAIEPPDMILFDITGVTHIFGGEAELVADIEARLARQGFAVRTAIAGTARAARAHCRFGRGGVVLPDAVSERVAGLPVEALECGLDILIALRRAGFLYLEDFLSRPREPLAARFGPELTDRLAQILEETDRSLTPRRPVPEFLAEQRFADPIGLMEDIALDSLAADLCGQLHRQGQGGRSFELGFYRADGKIERIGLLSGQPLADPGTLRRLFEMRLDALADPLDPGFGFDMMRLAVLAGDPLGPVQSGLDGKVEASREVSALVDRLSARFGAGAVQRLIARDTHLPERASLPVPSLSDARDSAEWLGTGEVPRRPLFLFYPAPQVDVVAEVPDGPPRRFRWRGVSHDVARAEGPERIAPEWWRRTTDTRTRDYFRIEDSEGQRFWLFRYGFYGREVEPVRWFLQGIFP